MKALGAQHSLNLDGGGTAAMYINGGYVIGPGRGVANAILLVK
jgi:exopolysaccharide biosynthesis protein